MASIQRRTFLTGAGRATLGAAMGAACWTSARPGRAVSPNEKIVVAMVGIRGRGYALTMGFATRPDCEVAYLADVDASLFGAAGPSGYAQQVDPALRGTRFEGVEKAQGKAPKTVQDFRRILDDRSVDAVVIATPDHWHALATVWSCQAGKDVYVEKPVSHDPWEGRKMIEAARKYGRIVQAGTQSRSAPYLWEAKKYIDEGKLGKIHFCRVFNMKFSPNFTIGPDSDPPVGFDWDMWNGPAPERPYNQTLRSGWHGLWCYSGGDIINDGVHQLDIARWLCGVAYPKSVTSTGGRFNSQGDDETPDTQVATFDFDNLLMTFEQTLYTPYMIKTDMEVRDGDIYPYWPQNTERVEIYGEEGVMYVGRQGAGWQVFGRQKNREPVIVAQAHGRFPDAVHKDNFVACLRSRQRPNADIEDGHLSTLLAQYANISYRLGGQKLQIDPQTESFVDSPKGNELRRREYRKPWVVPDEV
ncbi:MAG: Gfo/Idh/MocA family protein [Thermoguttaceae bacterium]